MESKGALQIEYALHKTFKQMQGTSAQNMSAYLLASCACMQASETTGCPESEMLGIEETGGSS